MSVENSGLPPVRGRRYRGYADLIACSAVAAASAAFGVLDEGGGVRAILGFLFVFFVPGYALSHILWKPGRGIAFADRILFSIGLSVSLTVFTAIFLSVGGVPLTSATLGLVIALETFLFGAASAVLRRRRGEGLPSEIVSAAARITGSFASDRAFWSVVAVLLVGALVIVAVILSAPPPAASTSLYLLGPDGTEASLPNNLTENVSASVLVDIYNGERSSQNFTVLACLALANGSCSSQNTSYGVWGTTLPFTPGKAYLVNVTLAQGAQVEETFRFSVTTSGKYVLSFTLIGGSALRTVGIPLTIHP